MIVCICRGLSDAAIREILGRVDGSDDACKALVDAALQNGGQDNVTVLIGRYQIPDAAAVQHFLDRFREELELPPGTANLTTPPSMLADQIRIALEEDAPLLSFAVFRRTINHLRKTGRMGEG